MMNTTKTLVCLMTAVCCAGFLSGCGDDKPDPAKIIPITDGSVKHVKVNTDGTGEITVSYFNEKAGKKVEGKAVVDGTTKVIINGEAAKLGDVKVGEMVSGEVRMEKDASGQSKLTAVRIEIDRAVMEGGTEDTGTESAQDGE